MPAVLEPLGRLVAQVGPGLEEQDRAGSGGGQTPGHHAAGGPGTNDDDVEFWLWAHRGHLRRVRRVFTEPGDGSSGSGGNGDDPAWVRR